MSALGNETSYRRAEGESTQWEDIQRRLGNFAAVKKPKVRRRLLESHDEQPVTTLTFCQHEKSEFC